jgi:UDP-N-acetylmuramate dehydrogenase
MPAVDRRLANGMKVTENPSLSSLNTFGLDARSKILYEIDSEEDLLTLPRFHPGRDLVLGGGSNIVLVNDVPGAVFLNRITGIDQLRDDGDRVIIEAAAGESWHGLVEWSLRQDLAGLENLSLIPGNVGAAPIQNIGAYGVELAEVLDSVTAWDWYESRWRTFDRADCRLAYRDSRFKSEEPDRYLITSIRLTLSRRFKPRIDYADLRAELERSDLQALCARDVSEAVIRLRRRKLPDPEIEGNAGSFFKNPVVEASRARDLAERHSGLPCWEQPDGRVKLSAAWMIDACGLKGRREGGAAVSERHALVLVNRGGASGHDVTALAIEVEKAVYGAFGIHLEPEPRLVELADS